MNTAESMTWNEYKKDILCWGKWCIGRRTERLAQRYDTILTERKHRAGERQYIRDGGKDINTLSPQTLSAEGFIQIWVPANQ